MSPNLAVLLASFGLLLRWGVSLWPHSGSNTPPMFGDFEAQRHWMEVTLHLPLKDWYENTVDNELQYWGLDYPPLTAYHSLAMGHIAHRLNSSWTALHTSRGLETSQHKMFMRLTVMVTDLLVLIPAIHLVAGDNPKVIATLLTYPGLILIDHGHFQYNSASLGLFLLAVAAIRRSKDCTASLLFVMALNYKQMELYHSLPFFFYLLSISVGQSSHLSKLTKLLSIAFTVIVTFVVIWAPFLLLGQDSVLQVLKRIFPFDRGLFEDKVSNFWCSLDVVVKLRHLLPIPDLAKLSMVTTLLLSLPSNLHLFLRPSYPTFLLALVNTSLVFFMFSFQVHEKSILLAAIPIALLSGQDKLCPSVSTIVPWSLSISTFSMLPLLIKDGLFLPCLSLSILFLTLLHSLPSLLPSPPPSRRPSSPPPSFPPTTAQLCLRTAMVLSLVGCVILSFLSVLVPPPPRYPYFWPLAVSVYSAVHFIFFLSYFHWVQLTCCTSSLELQDSKKTN